MVRAVYAAIVVWLVVQEPVLAQTSPASAAAGDDSHLGTMTANVAIGALLGGGAQLIRGGSFLDGVAAGAAGGALWYVGKRVAASEHEMGGLAGRQIAAVGTSLVGNVTAGRAVFERFTLPFGPVRVDIHPADLATTGFRLDVPSVVYAIHAGTQHDLSLDWSRSLSSGTIVLRGWSADSYGGRHVAGVLLLNTRLLADHVEDAVLDHEQRHETVHLIQHDFTVVTLGRPAQSAVLRRVPYGERIDRFVDLRPDALLWLALNRAVPHRSRPWEREARLLVPQSAFFPGH